MKNKLKCYQILSFLTSLIFIHGCSNLSKSDGSLTTHTNSQCYNHIVFDDGKCQQIVDVECDLKDSEYQEKQIIFHYFKHSRYSKVALEITAMSVIETGFWRSEFHRERNNLWSRKRLPDGKTCIRGEKNCLIKHSNIIDACIAMERYLKRKGYSEDNVELFLSQLKSKNFAEDPFYIKKVISVRNKIAKKYCE